jgi:hypothetical protein
MTCIKLDEKILKIYKSMLQKLQMFYFIIILNLLITQQNIEKNIINGPNMD